MQAPHLDWAKEQLATSRSTPARWASQMRRSWPGGASRVKRAASRSLAGSGVAHERKKRPLRKLVRGDQKIGSCPTVREYLSAVGRRRSVHLGENDPNECRHRMTSGREVN